MLMFGMNQLALTILLAYSSVLVGLAEQVEDWVVEMAPVAAVAMKIGGIYLNKAIIMERAMAMRQLIGGQIDSIPLVGGLILCSMFTVQVVYFRHCGHPILGWGRLVHCRSWYRPSYWSRRDGAVDCRSTTTWSTLSKECSKSPHSSYRTIIWAIYGKKFKHIYPWQKWIY